MRSYTKLINADTKNAATKLCKEITITHEQFSDFIQLSQEDGYEHELLRSEFLPNGIQKEEMPNLVHYEEGKEVYVGGETNLSEGQLKSAITQRKRIHVHFFDKNDDWHCFYFTFSDVKGDHWNEQEHIHYISKLWTLSKEAVKEALLSERRHRQVGEHVKYDLMRKK